MSVIDGTLPLPERRQFKCVGNARVESKWSRMMFDRQLLGDVLLALLVAIPTAALARPETVPHRQTAAPTHAPAVALASAADRQIGLYR